ncbi:hypothetical protein SAMN06265795_10852 [Noviherbaspirillum humi]|uniref:Uncharacterized protein n=1 Tax=Noviherbaspirillum humi TaxID=1688639 RepID=A0A239I020_9BURK|nr:hypothetical protein [Noviherbaspirillum humi]SNS87126.1 hypothetical protein SAMN06265795_10852 [Noviherbaspirillum humi]
MNVADGQQALAVVLGLLIFHGFIGGLDVVWNHEHLARLPRQGWARTEELLHAGRELIFALLFIGLGWFEWHGVAVAIIACLLLAEFGVTTTDTLLEDETRRLPHSERMLHVILLINFGAIVALLLPLLATWSAQPTSVTFVSHGWQSWALLVIGIVSFAWFLRDMISWRLLRRQPQTQQPALLRPAPEFNQSRPMLKRFRRSS